MYPETQAYGIFHRERKQPAWLQLLPLLLPTFSGKLLQMSHSQFFVLGRFGQTLENDIILQEHNATDSASKHTDETTRGNILSVEKKEKTYGSFAVQTQLAVGRPDHHRHALAVTVEETFLSLQSHIINKKQERCSACM